MQIDWMIVATCVFATVDALLVGAVITWTLISWGVL